MVNRSVCVLLVNLAIACALPGVVVAAEVGVPEGATPASVVRYLPLPPDQAGYVGALPEIYVAGTIDDTTLEQLKRVVETHGLTEARVLLDSTGGHVVAALELGYYLRERGFVTQVGAYTSTWGEAHDGQCYSACALAFLGGKYRYLGKDSLVGVHRFATDRADAAAASMDPEQEAQALAGLLVGYVGQMGVDVAFFKAMSEQPHDRIRLMDEDELRRMNVVNDGRMAPVWDLAIRQGGVVLVGEQQRIDNTGTVALACGDPLDVHLSTHLYGDALTKGVQLGDLQWALDAERFAVAAQAVDGSFSYEQGEVYVALRPDRSQLDKLLRADSIGLSTRVGDGVYEFFVDIAPGKDRETIRRFVAMCAAE